MGAESDSALSAAPQEPQEQQQPELDRTVSQLAAASRLENVKGHVGEITGAVIELRRSVSEVAKRVACDEQTQSLQNDLDVVAKTAKQARNLGEDLMEDMLVLDNLSRLIPEDKSSRKQALVHIESLLEDVDGAKGRLCVMQKALKSKIDVAEASAAADVHPTQQVSSHDSRISQAAQVPTPCRQASHVHSPLPKSPRAFASAKDDLGAPQPEADIWRKLYLPLAFQCQAKPEGYIIFAEAPGVRTKDLTLELNDDHSALTLNGILFPSPSECEAMQQELASRLRSMAMHSKLSDLELSLGAQSAYLEMGQNRFGHFSETFQLPADVDLEKVGASCRDGVLRVMLPRTLHRPMTMQSYGRRALGFAPNHPPPTSARRGLSDLRQGSFASPLGGVRRVFGSRSCA
jgi:HSP20 family molecular chaperone IbpA